MSVVVIDPPVGALVSLVEAKAHLRVDHDDDDTYITTLVAAAVGNIDGPAGWLGRALLSQVLEWRGDEFGTCDIHLPFPPIAEIVSVKYDDDDGDEQTVDSDVYRLIGVPSAARVALAYGQSWPSTRWQSEAVRIQYEAGYGAAADVPRPIKQAVLLMVGHWYANREAVTVGAEGKELPMAAKALLFPFQVLA